MNARQARRIIWERLATTAITDVGVADWFDENSTNGKEISEADIVRLEEASYAVSEIIIRRYVNPPKRIRAGICWTCSEPVKTGYKRCERHLKIHRDYEKARKQKVNEILGGRKQ